jgi:sucrose 6(F)-phosphate phosphorylase
MKNRVQLITYPDGLGGDLAGLEGVLREHFSGLFGGIHILPPFPSSGDRGFSPLTYDRIEPRFGSWADIRRLGKSYDIALDMMVNHVSSHSPFFRDFLVRGRDSEWADLFITLDKVWPDRAPTQTDVERIFLRRPKPWSAFQAGAPAKPVDVWTTFGKTDPSDQIDMDWRSPCFRSVIEGYFERFSANGVKIVRLDAIGYLAKRAGTSCFFLQPEMNEILGWLDGLAARYDVALLPEVHGRREVTLDLVRRGSWVYDFILPYRVLEALILRDPSSLGAYLADRPERQFTMLDCHDGVPVKPDLDGLYDPAAVRRVVDTCLARGGNVSVVYAPAHQDPDGFDVHQIRGTYYSLLDCDDDAYIAARAIQLFAPGVPQIYYVGLLAGENDHEAGARTGDGREINRHNYTPAEIRRATQREVVRRLDRLIRLRNSHPAFEGRFAVEPVGDFGLKLAWRAEAQSAELTVDFRSFESRVTMTDAAGRTETLAL